MNNKTVLLMFAGATQNVATQTTVQMSDKCLNTGSDIVMRSSSPMSVRGKAVETKNCDFTTLAAERLGRRKWERENSVREGVLVNLDTSDESEETDKPRGPRHCSVRLQAGTSNILLDNVVDSYTPVLYKSRPDALVHSPRSRSGSSNSSEERPLRTETQI